MIDPETFAEHLLAWFHVHQVDLPWRGVDDPYRIWLSEIMLQQTQIKSMREYYLRFITTYPTLESLALAPLEDVLKLWEGLGYYSRAKNLHRAAQIVFTQMNGELPSTVEKLRQLPGIGRYTAGAIASIAFNKAVPLVDGNVIRVFTRLYDMPQDVSHAATVKHLWQIAERHIPQDHPGDYNQALMELGQRICLPQQPLCDECPVASHCLAKLNHTQRTRPVKSKRPPAPHYDYVAGVIWRSNSTFLIVKRPLDGLLGGLWTFPRGRIEDHTQDLEDVLIHMIRGEYDLQVEVNVFFVRVKHAFTHFKMTLHVFHCTCSRVDVNALPPETTTWIKPHQFSDYSFDKASHKIMEAIRERQQMLF